MKTLRMILREYLVSLPDDSIAGIAANPCDCPLARALRFAGAPYAEIEDSRLMIERRGNLNIRRAPAWVSEFIESVDTCEDENHYPRPRPVAVEEARVCLNELRA